METDRLTNPQNEVSTYTRRTEDAINETYAIPRVRRVEPHTRTSSARVVREAHILHELCNNPSIPTNPQVTHANAHIRARTLTNFSQRISAKPCFLSSDVLNSWCISSDVRLLNPAKMPPPFFFSSSSSSSSSSLSSMFFTSLPLSFFANALQNLFFFPPPPLSFSRTRSRLPTAPRVFTFCFPPVRPSVCRYLCADCAVCSVWSDVVDAPNGSDVVDPSDGARGWGWGWGGGGDLVFAAAGAFFGVTGGVAVCGAGVGVAAGAAAATGGEEDTSPSAVAVAEAAGFFFFLGFFFFFFAPPDGPSSSSTSSTVVW